MNIIPNHSNMTALEMGLSPDIIIHDNLRPPTAIQRLRAYQARFDQWIENAPAQAELVKQPSKYPLITIPEGRTEMTNISKFLRKGGAK